MRTGPNQRRASSLAYLNLEPRWALNGDWSGGSEPTILDERSEFNEAGQLTLQEVIYDWNNDQVADQKVTQSFVYDASGRTAHATLSSDWGNDGTVEEFYETTQTYSSDGQLISVIESTWSEPNENGEYQVQHRTTNTFSYREDGQMASQVTEHWGPEGRQTQAQTWNYDEQGNVVSLTTESDFDGDGITDETSIIDLTPPPPPEFDGLWETAEEFDDQGRMIRNTMTYRSEPDGPVLYVVTQTWTYRADGQLESSLTQTDTDGDNSIDSQISETFAYDDQGVWEGIWERLDQDGDGEFETETWIDALDRSHQVEITSTGAELGGVLPMQDFVVDAGGAQPPALNLAAVGLGWAGTETGIQLDDTANLPLPAELTPVVAEETATLVTTTIAAAVPADDWRTDSSTGPASDSAEPEELVRLLNHEWEKL